MEEAACGPFTDTFFAPQDPVCLSPETPSVSLQRMTHGPLQARPSLSLPARERTRFQRVGETQAHASLPSQGRPRGVFPFAGENLFPEDERNPAPYKQDPLCLSLRGRGPGSRGWAKHRPTRLSPRRGEQEGSSPSQERTWFQRVSETRPPASLPRKLSGETKRGLARPGYGDSPID